MTSKTFFTYMTFPGKLLGWDRSRMFNLYSFYILNPHDRENLVQFSCKIWFSLDILKADVSLHIISARLFVLIIDIGPYTGAPRPPKSPSVMASSAMGLKLGVFRFCQPHKQKQKQYKCVHDFCSADAGDIHI